MGMGDSEFRLVDRDRSCRNSFFYFPVDTETKVENFNKQGCRSHDRICRDERCSLSCVAYGTCMGRFLYIPIPEYTWPSLGKFQFSSFLGLFCNNRISSDISFILVSWDVA